MLQTEFLLQLIKENKINYNFFFLLLTAFGIHTARTNMLKDYYGRVFFLFYFLNFLIRL